ncbi:hypothetical protein OX284_012130 [Flavobacterium sp. SUN046]|uniref:hypothetical protein n=1 Tax=Flavobacterium sp. SUN046 TaxID=3002440 RepID=UPI002DB737E9|nr:hypothetical protein [Flavobacterium sp. SUN046]MEC4050182.1 hypothetical protein [Flavobacterium sp. SUN046]
MKEKVLFYNSKSSKSWNSALNQAQENQRNTARGISSFNGNVSIGNHQLNTFDLGFYWG